MSEVKTAKVTGILGCKKWDGPKGTIYFHKIELDNGEVGEIGKKKENAFQLGDSVTYTSEQSEYGLKFKAVQENSNGFGGFKGGKSSGSPASFALSYAKDIAVANIAKSEKPLEMDAIADRIIATATKFHTFLKERE